MFSTWFCLKVFASGKSLEPKGFDVLSDVHDITGDLHVDVKGCKPLLEEKILV